MKEQIKLELYTAKAQPIRDAINARPLTDFYRLTRSGGGYVCPLCGSGTGQHKTGALHIRKTDNRVVCFSNGCFSGGGCQGSDTLGALLLLYPGMSEREIFSMCGYNLNDTTPSAAAIPQKPKENAADTPAPAHDFSAEIVQYAAALEGSPAQSYLQGRGLTLETMQRFNLGYNARKQAVVIPYNPQGSYYGQRRLSPNATQPHDNLTGVTIPLFNSAALYSADVCFIVESPLCAISLSQAGASAVAISGTSGGSRLIRQLRKRPSAAALVLCLDNDKPGMEATIKLGAELDKLGAFCVNATAAIMGEQTDATASDYRKDPNEILQRDGTAALQTAVNGVIEEVSNARNAMKQEAERERQQRTGAGMVDSFLQAIQTRQYEPIPTGMRDIDNAIGGGFMRQQLILLGAAPGAGKTALAQWIFQGMAKRGTNCVYLNLEMSREQMLARSISNIAARQGFKINANTILKGYCWTDEQRAAVFAAAEEYKKDIAPRMIYNPDEVTANLDTILEYIEKEAQTAEAAQMPAPIVVLDYLQLLSGQPREEETAVIKRAVAGLKGYAVKHNTLVFVIIAHNRKANSSGIVNLESGRDTSALEYSADLQLAITYTRCLKRSQQSAKTPEELTADEKKLVTLVITKARFGGQGREVDLYFDGETMTYSQVASDFIPYSGETPFSSRTVKRY